MSTENQAVEIFQDEAPVYRPGQGLDAIATAGIQRGAKYPSPKAEMVAMQEVLTALHASVRQRGGATKEVLEDLTDRSLSQFNMLAISML